MYSPDKLLYIGKTKDIYTVKNCPDLLILHFKDNILGRSGIPDSGGNEVIGKRLNKGRKNLAITSFFFHAFSKAGIRNHFIRKISPRKILIRKSRRIPIEFICRNYAYGGYLRTHPRVNRFKNLGGIIEYTLKSDEADDPILMKRQVLNFITLKEKKEINSVIKKINETASSLMVKRGVKIVDFKVEFGRLGKELILVDDFSADTARFMDSKHNFLSCFKMKHKLVPFKLTQKL